MNTPVHPCPPSSIPSTSIHPIHLHPPGIPTRGTYYLPETNSWFWLKINNPLQSTAYFLSWNWSSLFLIYYRGKSFKIVPSLCLFIPKFPNYLRCNCITFTKTLLCHLDQCSEDYSLKKGDITLLSASTILFFFFPFYFSYTCVNNRSGGEAERNPFHCILGTWNISQKLMACADLVWMFPFLTAGRAICYFYVLLCQSAV